MTGWIFSIQDKTQDFEVQFPWSFIAIRDMRGIVYIR